MRKLLLEECLPDFWESVHGKDIVNPVNLYRVQNYDRYYYIHFVSVPQYYARLTFYRKIIAITRTLLISYVRWIKLNDFLQ